MASRTTTAAIMVRQVLGKSIVYPFTSHSSICFTAKYYCTLNYVPNSVTASTVQTPCATDFIPPFSLVTHSPFSIIDCFSHYTKFLQSLAALHYCTFSRILIFGAGASEFALILGSYAPCRSSAFCLSTWRPQTKDETTSVSHHSYRRIYSLWIYPDIVITDLLDNICRLEIFFDTAHELGRRSATPTTTDLHLPARP